MNRFFFFIILNILAFHQAFAQVPVDCMDALTVCGNANLSFNSNGSGFNDFSLPGNQGPSCLQGENQSLWIQVPIQQSGTLGFTISANNPNDDYDFGIYGPNLTCSTLGSPIRCSFAPLVNNGVTGTRSSETETSDDDGDGWVSELNVVAGETYFMLIDNFSNSNNGFDLEWTGTAIIAGEPTIETPVDQQICDPENDGTELFDLAALDNIISRNDIAITVSYHSTQDDATLGSNALPKDYIASNGDRIFARGTFTSNGCAATTEFVITLTNGPDDISIVGPASVCPDVMGVAYRAEGDAGNTYEWFIDGGQITAGATSSEVTVNWEGTNPAAYLELIPTNSEGCVGETIRYDVRINTRLEPVAPIGPQEVCTSGNTEAIYNVPLTNGSQYDWLVENGTVISGAGTNEVTVRWDGDQPGQISFREFNPAIADCEGTSPTVDISFFPAVTAAPTSQNVSCFGQSTGTISLNEGGGTGVLRVRWDDGNTDFNRSNLPAGDYTYTITDDNNCELSETITITQPEELVVANLDQANLLCFQNNGGFAEVTIAGGTAPYSYSWTRNGNDLNINRSFINSQPAGTYNVVITDANGCTTDQIFNITEPPLLEPDLSQLINNPICPQASDGEVTVGAMGGTPDYEFIWRLNPEQRGPQATGLSRGTYTVDIFDANSCNTSQTVEVVEQFPRVYLPNTFTPNGDGDNDVFMAIAHCPLGSFRMMVFNEWGSPIFGSSDISNGWTAFLDGEEVPLGTYAYKVAYNFNVNGKLFSETIHGQIRVIR